MGRRDDVVVVGVAAVVPRAGHVVADGRRQVVPLLVPADDSFNMRCEENAFPQLAAGDIFTFHCRTLDLNLLFNMIAPNFQSKLLIYPNPFVTFHIACLSQMIR